jgi:uncharacterized protein YwbE
MYPESIAAFIRDPVDPGDQTVPMRSADDQLNSGKLKEGVVKQVMSIRPAIRIRMPWHPHYIALFKLPSK